MKTKNLILVILCSFIAVSFLWSDGVEQEEQGVYEYVLHRCDMEFEEASAALEEAIQFSNFELAAKFDQATPEGCALKTRVFILFDEEYAKDIIEINRLTGPFAVPDRINLFEDEKGIHVSIVNSININRTILMDDEMFNEISLSHKHKLRDLVHYVLTGDITNRQFGQFRSKGFIKKTMGIMAGGTFDEKLLNVVVAPGESLEQVVETLESELRMKDGKWGLGHIYSIVLADEGIAIIGTSSPAVESRSFSIVKAGGDKTRKKLACPGIAHAAAYPMEIVIEKKKSVYWIRIVNSMYRMKMYFEDAGKMAFAANMGMPGSIEKELTKKIERAFLEK